MEVKGKPALKIRDWCRDVEAGVGGGGYRGGAWFCDGDGEGGECNDEGVGACE